MDHDTTKLINKINEILQLKKIYFDERKNIQIIIIIIIIVIIIIYKNNFIHRFKKNRLFTDSRI